MNLPASLPRRPAACRLPDSGNRFPPMGRSAVAGATGETA